RTGTMPAVHCAIFMKAGLDMSKWATIMRGLGPIRRTKICGGYGGVRHIGITCTGIVTLDLITSPTCIPIVELNAAVSVPQPFINKFPYPQPQAPSSSLTPSSSILLQD
ncbi:hypothetical protein PIB30_059938, partial [Stylosanthes scabra]|nr:hypothetical protein [Stylosanthes scabra]